VTVLTWGVGVALAVFRSFLGILATVAWCSLALLARPLWRRSVIALQPYWARTVLACAGVKVRVNAAAAAPPAPVVYVSNHQSGLDILVMIAWMPDSVRFVAKKEMASAPFTGWCMRAADYIFIDRANSERAKQSLREAAAQLRHGGRSVIIFPEGHRHPPGTLGPFKMGAIHLAMEAGVPVVPVGITNSGVLMERKSLISRSGSVDINIGPPLDPTRYVGREKQLRDLLRVAVKHLAGDAAALDADDVLEQAAARLTPAAGSPTAGMRLNTHKDPAPHG
jgi:1-acyl-sn-glycerol-3-phosphate acyltransferase